MDCSTSRPSRATAASLIGDRSPPWSQPSEERPTPFSPPHDFLDLNLRKDESSLTDSTSLPTSGLEGVRTRTGRNSRLAGSPDPLHRRTRASLRNTAGSIASLERSRESRKRVSSQAEAAVADWFDLLRDETPGRRNADGLAHATEDSQSGSDSCYTTDGDSEGGDDGLTLSFFQSSRSRSDSYAARPTDLLSPSRSMPSLLASLEPTYTSERHSRNRSAQHPFQLVLTQEDGEGESGSSIHLARTGQRAARGPEESATSGPSLRIDTALANKLGSRPGPTTAAGGNSDLAAYVPLSASSSTLRPIPPISPLSAITITDIFARADAAGSTAEETKQPMHNSELEAAEPRLPTGADGLLLLNGDLAPPPRAKAKTAPARPPRPGNGSVDTDLVQIKQAVEARERAEIDARARAALVEQHQYRRYDTYPPASSATAYTEWLRSESLFDCAPIAVAGCGFGYRQNEDGSVERSRVLGRLAFPVQEDGRFDCEITELGYATAPVLYPTEATAYQDLGEETGVSRESQGYTYRTEAQADLFHDKSPGGNPFLLADPTKQSPGEAATEPPDVRVVSTLLNAPPPLPASLSISRPGTAAGSPILKSPLTPTDQDQSPLVGLFPSSPGLAAWNVHPFGSSYSTGGRLSKHETQADGSSPELPASQPDGCAQHDEAEVPQPKLDIPTVEPEPLLISPAESSCLSEPHETVAEPTISPGTVLERTDRPSAPDEEHKDPKPDLDQAEQKESATCTVNINGEEVCCGCRDLLRKRDSSGKRMRIVKSADGLFLGRYHIDCLACADCGLQLVTGGSRSKKGSAVSVTESEAADSGGRCYILNAQPLCRAHYHARNGTVCIGCGTGIEGAFLNLTRRKWTGPDDPADRPVPEGCVKVHVGCADGLVREGRWTVRIFTGPGIPNTAGAREPGRPEMAAVSAGHDGRHPLHQRLAAMPEEWPTIVLPPKPPTVKAIPPPLPATAAKAGPKSTEGNPADDKKLAVQKAQQKPAPKGPSKPSSTSQKQPVQARPGSSGQKAGSVSPARKPVPNAVQAIPGRKAAAVGAPAGKVPATPDRKPPQRAQSTPDRKTAAKLHSTPKRAATIATTTAAALPAKAPSTPDQKAGVAGPRGQKPQLRVQVTTPGRLRPPTIELTPPDRKAAAASAGLRAAAQDNRLLSPTSIAKHRPSRLQLPQQEVRPGSASGRRQEGPPRMGPLVQLSPQNQKPRPEQQQRRQRQQQSQSSIPRIPSPQTISPSGPHQPPVIRAMPPPRSVYQIAGPIVNQSGQQSFHSPLPPPLQQHRQHKHWQQPQRRFQHFTQREMAALRLTKLGPQVPSAPKPILCRIPGGGPRGVNQRAGFVRAPAASGSAAGVGGV